MLADGFLEYYKFFFVLCYRSPFLGAFIFFLEDAGSFILLMKDGLETHRDGQPELLTY